MCIPFFQIVHPTGCVASRDALACACSGHARKICDVACASAGEGDVKFDVSWVALFLSRLIDICCFQCDVMLFMLSACSGSYVHLTWLRLD